MSPTFDTSHAGARTAARTAARQAFAELVRAEASQPRLAEACLWIASEEYPDLDVAEYLQRLRELGERAGEALASRSSVRDGAVRLTGFVFDELGFSGNRQNYYDTRNSYLNEVIDRRTGIPITLAIVYLELARRSGLEAQGVGFPGHFLIKCPDEVDTIVDPFSGEILTHDECVARYQSAVGGSVPFDARALDPTPARHILARVLGNLKQLYLVAKDFQRALACSERILMLVPAEQMPMELRDRGLLFARLECFGPALADLKRFLELSPGNADAEKIRLHLLDLERRASSLH